MVGWRSRLFIALVEWLAVMPAIAFGLGGHGGIVPLAVAVATVLVLRQVRFRHRWLRLTLGMLYLCIVVFALNSVSVLMLYLYHAGWFYFLLYLAIVGLSTFILFKLPLFGLRPHHGALFSAIYALVALCFLLVSLPSSEDCAVVREGSGLNQIADFAGIDYGFMPWRAESTGDGRVLFVANRKAGYVANRREGAQREHRVIRPEDDPLCTLICHEELGCPDGSVCAHHLGDSEASRPIPLLLRVDLETGAMDRVDTGGESVASLKRDPITGGVLALTYNEQDGLEAVAASEAHVLWIDAQGVVTDRIGIGREGNLYSVLDVTEAGVAVYLSSDRLRFDAGTRKWHAESLKNDKLVSTLVDFGRVGDKYLLLNGGPVIDLLIFPGIRLVDPTTFETLFTRRPLGGAYVLGLDPSRERIYVNGQWSGHIDVLNHRLERIRGIDVVDVCRAMALDPPHRLGYAVDYQDGDVVRFGMDSGDVERVGQIGSGARMVHLLPGGDAVVGSSCGLFLVEGPEAP